MIELCDASWEERLRDYLTNKTRIAAPRTSSSVLGFRRGDKIAGCWMLERYTGPYGSAVGHWAGETGWLTRGVLSLTAHYVFHQLMCYQIIGEVPASATALRRVNEHLGFRKVAEIPNYWPTDTLILYALKRDECRWLDVKEYVHVVEEQCT